MKIDLSLENYFEVVFKDCTSLGRQINVYGVFVQSLFL